MAVLFKGKILNDDEINYLRNLSTQKERYKEFKDDTGELVDEKSDFIDLEKNPSKEYLSIKNKLDNLVCNICGYEEESNKSYFDRLIKYEIGCFIGRHKDIGVFETAITIIELSDDLRGGELYVNKKHEKLNIGETIIFERDKHEVKEVTSGTRIVYALWYN